MNISDVASVSGLSAKTIRYYEDIGLVHPNRGPNGYRLFDKTHVDTLTFLARARSLGFTIYDCRALIELYQDQSRASADVKRMAEKHLTHIQGRIEELQLMYTILLDLVKRCQGDTGSNCPILESLAGDKNGIQIAW